MTRISEQVSLAMQAVVDAGRTAVKSLIHPVYNVKGFGAKGDGISDDLFAIQAAVDAAYDAGGGVVFFPPGTYMVRGRQGDAYIHGIQLKDNVTLLGVKNATYIKPLGNEPVAGLVGHPYYDPTLERVTGGTVKNVAVIGLILDCRKGDPDRTRGSTPLRLDGVEGLYVQDCVIRKGTDYGAAFQAYNDAENKNPQTDILFVNTIFEYNGRDGVDFKSGDRITFINCVSRYNDQQGFDVRGTNVTYVGCRAHNNTGDGWHVKRQASKRTIVSLHGCAAWANSSGMLIQGINSSFGHDPATEFVSVDIFGFTSYSNTGQAGIYFDPLENLRVHISGAECFNNPYGIRINTQGANWPFKSFFAEGVRCYSNTIDGVLTDGKNTRWVNCEFTGNAQRGFRENAPGTNNLVEPSCLITGNGTGQITTTSNTVASAADMTIPDGTPMGEELIYVSGSATVNNILPLRAGRRITIIPKDGAATFTLADGAGNMRLASNFVGTTYDCITLICDGSNWFEVSRSVN